MRAPYYLFKRGKYYTYRLDGEKTFRTLNKIAKLKSVIDRGKIELPTSQAKAKKLVEWYIYEYQAPETRAECKTFKGYAKDFYVAGKCPLIEHRRDEGKSIGSEHILRQRALLENYIFDDEISSLPIDKITRGNLLDFRKRIKEKKTAALAEKVMGVAKAIFKEAFYREDIDRDPTAGIGKLKYEKQKITVFSKEQIDKILYGEDTFQQDYHRIAIVLAYFGGLRKSEILALTWKDVDFDTHIITVRQAWKDWSKRELGPPKWGKVRRVPMTKEFENELYSFYQDTLFCAAENFVITNNSGEPVSPRTPGRWLEYALKQAEITETEGLRFHSFRHTRITELQESGVAPVFMKEVIGHTAEKTTEGYTHLSNDFLVEELKKI